MRKISKHLLTVIASITTIIAAFVASSACFWYAYQPEEPKCLGDE